MLRIWFLYLVILPSAKSPRCTLDKIPHFINPIMAIPVSQSMLVFEDMVLHIEMEICPAQNELGRTMVSTSDWFSRKLNFLASNLYLKLSATNFIQLFHSGR